MATVEVRPNRSGHRFLLRNVSNETWTVTPEGEEPKKVEPSQLLGVRTMTIDFGPAQGTIEVSGSQSSGETLVTRQ